MARKKSNIHYIYKTTCNVTGKWYVGMHSTSNLEDGYMGSGLILRRSIRKYGINNHTKEILEYLDSREILVIREREIVTKELIDDDLCMNLKEGGNGGWNELHNKSFKEKLLTDKEFKESFSKKRTEINNRLILEGKLTSINGRYDWTDKKHTEETKQLMSEISKGMGIGDKNSQYGTCWITKDGINKKIKKEEFEIYLDEGWVKGRKIN